MYLDLGHAFEARIYAENVPRGFLPATGTLYHYRPVPSGPTGNILQINFDQFSDQLYFFDIINICLISKGWNWSWRRRCCQHALWSNDSQTCSVGWKPQFCTSEAKELLVKLSGVYSSAELTHFFSWGIYSRIRYSVVECVYGSLFQEVHFCLSVFRLWSYKISSWWLLLPIASHFLLSLPSH